MSVKINWRSVTKHTHLTFMCITIIDYFQLNFFGCCIFVSCDAVDYFQLNFVCLLQSCCCCLIFFLENSANHRGPTRILQILILLTHCREFATELPPLLLPLKKLVRNMD